MNQVLQFVMQAKSRVHQHDCRVRAREKLHAILHHLAIITVDRRQLSFQLLVGGTSFWIFQVLGLLLPVREQVTADVFIAAVEHACPIVNPPHYLVVGKSGERIEIRGSV